MKFWDYTTQYSAATKFWKADEKLSIEQFEKDMCAQAFRYNDPTTINLLNSERRWNSAHKPYYNLWPAIAPMLLRLNLDLDTSLITLPCDALLLRMPEDLSKNVLAWDDEHCVRSILAVTAVVREEPALTLWLDIGETTESVLGFPDGCLPIRTYRQFRTAPGRTLEREIEELPHDASSNFGVQLPSEIEKHCVRLVATLCLMAGDPEIISPDVLASDQDKFDQTGDKKYIEKAKKRGKLGWNVGKSIEVIPHYRRPHPALMWTGHGRTVPKIVMRKGTIVHRNVVEKLPTGYMPKDSNG